VILIIAGDFCFKDLGKNGIQYSGLTSFFQLKNWLPGSTASFAPHPLCR